MNKIDVYLISPLNQPRNKHLVELFSTSPVFNLIQVPAIMTPEFSNVDEAEIVFDEAVFRNFTGRNFRPAELGCAASHNEARKLVSLGETSALILEDDAVVKNLNQLFSILELFNGILKEENSILNLTDFLTSGQIISAVDDSEIPDTKFLKLIGQAPLAVASFMSPGAAKTLVAGNTPISWVSDWPRSNCSFYVANVSVISHSQETRVSLIDPAGVLARNAPKPQGERLFSFLKLLFMIVTNRNRGALLERLLNYKILYRIDRIRVQHFVNSLDS